MIMYCKSITEINGRRFYGIDAVMIAERRYIVLYSVRAFTDDFKFICLLVDCLNSIPLPLCRLIDIINVLRNRLGDHQN